METFMTVLKKFWLDYKLKKIVNRRKSASVNKTKNIFSKDRQLQF